MVLPPLFFGNAIFALNCKNCKWIQSIKLTIMCLKICVTKQNNKFESSDCSLEWPLFSYKNLIKESEECIMKEFWNVIQLVFAGIGGWLGYFLGGCDGLLYALIVFAVIDYITGVMCAINDRTLSSEVEFKGICRKVMIFLLVGIGHILDMNVIGTGSVLRTAVMFFYISNEGVSLLENAAHLGLPVPQKIKDVLEQLHKRSEMEDK